MVNKIYNINNGKIEVYSYSLIKDNYRKFLGGEYYKIPEDERLLKVDPPATWFTPKADIVYSCGAFVLKKKPKEGRMTMDPVEESLFNGNYLSDPIRVVNREDNGEELIYLSPYGDFYDIKIQITERMKMALLLAREGYLSDELQDNDLAEYSGLFEISKEPIFEIDLSEVRKMYMSSLVSGNFGEKYNYIEKSSKVYSKLKK